MKNIWNKENCETEAKKYKTNKEFRTFSASAYGAARINGWLNDYTWLEKRQKPSGYWNYDRCYEEAKKYKYLSDFEKGSKSAHTISCKNKWMKNYTWLKKKQKPSGYWNYERCYEEAKKYNKLIDFYDNSGSAAATAIKNGWMEEYIWLEKRHIYTYEEIFNIALNYSTIKDFREKENSCYHKAQKQGWLNDYKWLQKCVDPYKENADCVYMYLNEKNKIVYVGRTIRPEQRHSKHKSGKLAETFLKYGVELPEPIYYMNNAKFPVEYGLMIEDKIVNWFKNEGWTVINKAKTGKISGSLGAAKRIWTKAKVMEVARSCKSIKDFYTNYASAYEAALKNKWLNEIFPNRNRHLSKNNHTIKMYTLDGAYIRDFKNQKEIISFFNKNCLKTVRKCLYNKTDKALGYKWKWGDS